MGADDLAIASSGADERDGTIDVTERAGERGGERSLLGRGPVDEPAPGALVADGVQTAEAGRCRWEGEVMESSEPPTDLLGQRGARRPAVGAPAHHPLVDADELTLDLGEHLSVLVEPRRGHGQDRRLRGELDLDGPLDRPGVAVRVERAVEDLHREAAPVGVEADDPVREPSLDVDRGARGAQAEAPGDGVEELGQR